MIIGTFYLQHELNISSAWIFLTFTNTVSYELKLFLNNFPFTKVLFKLRKWYTL